MTNLDKLEKLERAATKGPWHDASGKGSAVVSAPGENCAVYLNVRAVELDETVARWQADAALIVALRNEAVPMIQELRELRNEVEEHKAIKRHVAQRVIEAIGASGPENLNDSVGRLLAERDALRAEVEGLKEKLKDDQERVDAVVYYRNLAIVLGAKPNQMRGESDSKLCEMGIDPDDDEGGYSVSMNDVIHENEKLWEAVGEVAELRAQLATAREDALEEAAKACVKIPAVKGVVHEHYEQGYNNAVDDAVERIRALKTTKGDGT